MTQTRKTTIVVSQKTKSQLEKLGNMRDTHDSVIVSLLAHTDKCNSFWENNDERVR
jgi:hypothetical protein